MNIDQIEQAITRGADVQLKPDGTVVVREPMSATLEDKLATMVWYMEERASKRISSDKKAIASLLDDSEICRWLDKMKKAGRVINTQFTSKKV